LRKGYQAFSYATIKFDEMDGLLEVIWSAPLFLDAELLEWDICNEEPAELALKAPVVVAFVTALFVD